MSPLQNTEKLYAILKEPSSGGPDDLFRLRASFAKRGRAVYLSHLEVKNALERTVRRAALPYAITQGFSPHMKTVFGSALPVGVGGERELFDVYLRVFVPPDEAASALRDASVTDLFVFSCEYVERSAPAPDVAYPVGVYEVRTTGKLPSAVVPPTFVTVVRKGKEKVLQVPDYLVAGPVVDDGLISFALASRETGSLRSDVFAEALLAEVPGAGIRSITRTMQLTNPYGLGF